MMRCALFCLLLGCSSTTLDSIETKRVPIVVLTTVAPSTASVASAPRPQPEPEPEPKRAPRTAPSCTAPKALARVIGGRTMRLEWCDDGSLDAGTD